MKSDGYNEITRRLFPPIYKNVTKSITCYNINIICTQKAPNLKSHITS